MKLESSLKFEDWQWTVIKIQLVPSEHGPSEDLEYNNIVLLLCFYFHFMENSFVKIVQKFSYNDQVWDNMRVSK